MHMHVMQLPAIIFHFFNSTMDSMTQTIKYNYQWLKYYLTADCGLPLVNRYLQLNFSSTLQGSVLTLTCENEILNFNMNVTKEILNVTCDSNGSWIPNPADFIQSCSLFSTTVSPTTGIDDNSCWLLPSNQSCFRQIATVATRGVHVGDHKVARVLYNWC